MLVVGQPGVGKSGVLVEAASALMAAGRDVLFVTADRLETGDPAKEAGLQASLATVLDAWSGSAPAVLFIDGLDGARDEVAAMRLRLVMEEVLHGCSRWRLVASIRPFELRCSPQLEALFISSRSKSLPDDSFRLEIDRFTLEEVAQIATQSQRLFDLIQATPAAFQDLVRVPFNLWLVAQILGTSAPDGDLRLVKSQLQLLSLFWRYRVEGPNVFARERLLRQACAAMITERRLRVSVDTLQPPDDVALRDLRSAEVLVPWRFTAAGLEERVLAFSHHVLFDYAAARLLFTGEVSDLVTRLCGDPGSILMIGPSLLLHFHELWDSDASRGLFWASLLRFVASDVPEMAKVMGVAVAAERAESLDDLRGLVTALEADDGLQRTTADSVFAHLIGALLSGRAGPLIGSTAGPWAELLGLVRPPLRNALAYPIRALLYALLRKPAELTRLQMAGVATSARAILARALADPVPDRLLYGVAVEGICRTYELDAKEAEIAIRTLIDGHHLHTRGFAVLGTLADETPQLLAVNEALVADIFTAAFHYRETSKDQTPFGGALMPLVSDKAQDYDMGLYRLAQWFPEYLAATPMAATRALIRIAEDYVSRKHPPYAETPVEEMSFPLPSGHQATIRADRSRVWDEGIGNSSDYEVQMLSAWSRGLGALAAAEATAPTALLIAEGITAENRVAILWRRLLKIAAKHPQVLGRSVKHLAWSAAVLTLPDTMGPAEGFLRALFPLLEDEDRSRIETTVLALPAGICHRFLRCLGPPGELATEEARHAVESLLAKEILEPTSPSPVSFEHWSADREEDIQRSEGVDVDAPQNRQVRELAEAVADSAAEFRTRPSAPLSVENAVALMCGLHDALGSSSTRSVHVVQIQRAWATLADACDQVATRGDHLAVEASRPQLTAWLLEALALPDPQVAGFEDVLDEPIASQSLHMSVARGLCSIVWHGATENVLAAVERLSHHPSPQIRLQIAERLVSLLKNASDCFWSVAERFGRTEESLGVLRGLLDSLQRVAGRAPDPTAAVVMAVYDRTRDLDKAKDLRADCVEVCAGLFVWQDQAACRTLIYGVASDPLANLDAAKQLPFQLRPLLVHGPVAPPDVKADAVRERARALFMELTRRAADALRLLLQPGQPPPSEEARDRFKSLTSLVDQIASELYFASGAFKSSSSEDMPALSKDARRRFYEELAPALDELADVSLPSIAHRLVEILDDMVGFDPPGVLRRLAAVVRHSKRFGYCYEPLAAGEIVKQVSRYLADHRALLQENKQAQGDLLEILDAFSGWPEARQLMFGLDIW